MKASCPEDRLEQQRRKAVAALETLLYAPGPPVEVLSDLLKIDVRGGRQTCWPHGKEAIQRIRNILKEVRELIKYYWKTFLPTLEDWTPQDEQLARLQDMLRQAHALLRKHREQLMGQEQVLTFTDLEVQALEALEHQKVREYYHQRWRILLLDESQDTSRIQGALLEALLRNIDLTCTIVGDEKQAIYGFRGATTEVFARLQNHIEEERGGEIIALQESFRMHAALINHINRLFASVLPDYQHLKPATPREGPERPLRHMVIDDRECSRWERIAMEGRFVAQEIQRLLEEGSIYDPETRTMRRPTYGDIAVLSRTWAALDEVELFLQEAGIPTVNIGGGNLLETPEGRDIRAFLHFLADPTNDMALLTLLRSPFFAIPDTELARMAFHRPETSSWWMFLKNTRELPESLTHARDVLTPFIHHRRYVETPLELVQAWCLARHYPAIVASLPGGPRHEADLKGMLAFIQRYENQGILDVFTLVRKLRELEEGGYEVPRPLMQANDAVTLMTIHAAKGLEWPVVFLIRINRQEPPSWRPLYLDPVWGAACKLPEIENTKQDTLLERYLQRKHQEEVEAEWARLAYVAATRARDKLVLVQDKTFAPRNGLGTVFTKALASAGIPEEPIPRISSQNISLQPPTFRSPKYVLTQPINGTIVSLPVSALVDFYRCPYRGYHLHLEGHPGVDEGATLAMRIGSLVHEAMYRNIRTPDKLKHIAPDLPDEQVGEAWKLVHTWYTAPAFQDIRTRIQDREKPILWHSGKLAYRGRVDALGEDFVLDFKTDQEMIPHEHHLQLWVYREATRRSNAYIAYLRHQRLYAYSEEELDKAAQTFREVENLILDGDRTPRPEYQKCCYCPIRSICPEGQKILQEETL